MAFYRPREKVFDIRFGDTIVKGNVDIFREVGFAQPYDLFFEFKLKKGVIYLKVKKFLLRTIKRLTVLMTNALNRLFSRSLSS